MGTSGGGRVDRKAPVWLHLANVRLYISRVSDRKWLLLVCFLWLLTALHAYGILKALLNYLGATSIAQYGPYSTYLGYHGPGTCSLNGLADQKLSDRVAPIPVYDVFIFDQELDMLEIRLNELAQVVTKFILIEGTVTFMNKHKALHFDEHKNEPRFRPFLDKVVHVKLNDIPGDQWPDGRQVGHWDREFYTREEGAKRGVEMAGVKDGDLVIWGDVDEVPRATVIDVLRHCEGYPWYQVLISRFYYFSYEFRHEKDWHFPNVFVWPPRNVGEWREIRGDKGPSIADAGWHCSYCFKDPKDYLHKLGSTTHPEKNNAMRRTALSGSDVVLQAYCNGLDLAAGAWTKFEVNYSAVSLPEHILKRENIERFRYLLPGKCPPRKFFNNREW